MAIADAWSICECVLVQIGTLHLVNMNGLAIVPEKKPALWQ
jgi:hypothetical protein